MTNNILVVGGGVAGITASLDLAEQGHTVYLVEKNPSIGGKMAQLDKTFPTLDCSLCILAPRMVEMSRHPNINLLTYSEVKKVEPISNGSAFRVKILKKPRFVNEERCTGCQICTQKCPVIAPNEFDEGLANRKAIYIPFPQAVPAIATIDNEKCLFFTRQVCQICKKFCQADAIDFEQKPKELNIEVAAIIVATGFELLDSKLLPRYGYKKFPDVITSLEYERLMNAAGPTGGKVIRLSDETEPKTIAFIQCVGSRNENCKPYCSQICCMYATKEAIVTKEHTPDVDITIFFDNLRATGKEHQEFMRRASEEFNIRYVKGLPSEIQLDTKSKKLSLRYADLISSEVKSVLVDLVILCPAVIPAEDTKELSTILGLELTEYGFYKTLSPLTPVDTLIPGIYVAGACTDSKDISHSVAQASASALRATSRTNLLKAAEEPAYEEKAVGTEPRIGVFICRCGINIGSVVDVPKVVDYARDLDNVVHAQEFLFSCSKDATEKIKDVIEEADLNRVIVASCTPRTHEPLFRKTCEEAGLNPYLFEMVNIREHDSWVHPEQPEEATRKATTLVHMAVEKARLLKPLKKLEVEVIPSALIIGGGLSGLVAAKAVGDKGFKAYIIETENHLGGRRAKDFNIPFEREDFNILLDPLIKAVKNHDNIDVFLSSQIKEVKGSLGNFKVTFAGDAETTFVNVGVIINATGSEELKPRSLYGYGEVDNIFTLSEFRKVLEKPDFSKEENIAIILCAGSREKEGRTYCSATCCAEALSIALKVLEKQPNLQIFVLYRDIRLLLEDEKYYREARGKGITFIRYDPEHLPKVTPKAEGLCLTVRDTILEGNVLDLFVNKVILATPLVPRKTNQNLASTLKIPLTTKGFFLEAHPKLRPLDFATDGIYLCGTCHSPQSVTECVYQALGAASRALIPLMKAKVKSEAITAVVHPEICIACGNCEAVCEYGAIKVDTGYAEVNSILCKGCGTCSVECPAMAITMQGFTNDQLSSMIEAALKSSSEEDELNILAFFCNWCAYAGADMAGVSRYHYPPSAKIIRVMCSGRVEENHILQAFLLGADGVLIGGCHPGDCHYISGNLQAEKRVKKMKTLLKAAGLEPERLRLEWVSAGEGQRLAEVMKEFSECIRKLGSNPLKLTKVEAV